MLGFHFAHDTSLEPRQFAIVFKNGDKDKYHVPAHLDIESDLAEAFAKVHRYSSVVDKILVPSGVSMNKLTDKLNMFVTRPKTA